MNEAWLAMQSCQVFLLSALCQCPELIHDHVSSFEEVNSLGDSHFVFVLDKVVAHLDLFNFALKRLSLCFFACSNLHLP